MSGRQEGLREARNQRAVQVPDYSAVHYITVWRLGGPWIKRWRIKWMTRPAHVKKVKVKFHIDFTPGYFYSASIAATAFRALAVGYSATQEKLLRQGSNPGRWLRS